jgi:hypothetical protein
LRDQLADPRRVHGGHAAVLVCVGARLTVNHSTRTTAWGPINGVGHNLAYIDDDFTKSYPGLFDPVYMNKLFQYGRAKARSSFPWWKYPLGLAHH